MKKGTYLWQQTSLLAKVGNSRPVVMVEHISTEDGISDLRCVNQVHLQETSLEMALLRLVVLQRIQQERSRLLNHIL